MNVAVIYEESYTLYGQFHQRSIYAVIRQQDGEQDKAFSSRINEKIKKIESIYSYYDYEILNVED